MNANPKEELNLLDNNMNDLTSELNDLFKFENSPFFQFYDCEQHVAFSNNRRGNNKFLNRRGSVPTDVQMNNDNCENFENWKMSENAANFIFHQTIGKPATSDLKLNDFPRRSSAGDILLNHGPNAAFFNRRASAADAQDINLNVFEFSSGKNNREELRKHFREIYEHKYARITRNLDDKMAQFFPNLRRRGSAADAENACSELEKFVGNFDHTKRRASAADAEPFSKFASGKCQPAALINVAKSNETPHYWHVGPEVVTITNVYKKFSHPQLPTAEAVLNDNKETISDEVNDVVRLFNLFRIVNIYLVDVEPFDPNSGILDKNFNSFKSQRLLMPLTMNIRTQIKHIIYKCFSFCQEKSRKLDQYHCADRQQYFECSRLLFVLRKVAKQLEPFKNVDFEHRNTTFVDTFAAAKAKNLELVLHQMIDKIRECNINIEVYRWSIQQNIQETGLTCLETLEKAVAIVAAMKIKDVSKENPNLNLPMKSVETVNAANGGEAKNIKIDNNENAVGNLHELENENLRNTKRFIGNFN